jgi:hypothetical protein
MLLARRNGHGVHRDPHRTLGPSAGTAAGADPRSLSADRVAHDEPQLTDQRVLVVRGFATAEPRIAQRLTDRVPCRPLSR